MEEEGHTLEESGTTDIDQPEGIAVMSDITFENLHQGELVVRFEENARSVAITWIPDDPEAEPFREHRSLTDVEFDGECFSKCYNECVEGETPPIVCVFRCLVQCGGGG